MHELSAQAMPPVAAPAARLPAPPAALAARVLALQRGAGNAAVTAWLGRARIGRQSLTPGRSAGYGTAHHDIVANPARRPAMAAALAAAEPAASPDQVLVHLPPPLADAELSRGEVSELQQLLATLGVGRPGQDGEPVVALGLATGGATGNGGTLGPGEVGSYFVCGVELRFDTLEAEGAYSNLQPRQWAGPEGMWLKRGQPLGGDWTTVPQRGGGGADDPQPESITRRPGRVDYYDSPGPSVFSISPPGGTAPSRAHVVQCFTGWIEGTPADGGAPRRISPVLGWHSVVSLFNDRWDADGGVPHWQHMGTSGAGEGWVPVTPPSV